jgi:hypothetical protein
MGVPSDQLMDLIRKGQPKVASPVLDTEKPALSGAETPPMSAPMLTPEDKQGDQANAKVNVQMAMDLMQQALVGFGSDSKEGKVILDVISSLAKVFGETEGKTRELIPAEIMQMIQSLPQTGAASPAMRALAAAPVKGLSSPPLPI